MRDEDPRWDMLCQLHPHIACWSAMRWGAESVQAAAFGHPCQCIRYGVGLVRRLNAALRPYRYTMRRKIRKAYAS